MGRNFSEFSEFRESDKSVKHKLESVKDPVRNTCLAGAVLAYWSLTKEVAGSSPFTVMTNIFVTEFAKFAKFSGTFRINPIVFSIKVCIICYKIQQIEHTLVP